MSAHSSDALGDDGPEVEASVDVVAAESAQSPPSTQISQPEQRPETARKAKPKPRGKPQPPLNLCLADYVHQKKVVVTREKLHVDETLSQGQMRRMDPGRLLLRYNNLKASPPPDILDELLVSNLSMSLYVCFRTHTTDLPSALSTAD